MKILKLHIENFRNIRELDFDLSNHNGMSVFIGNNGCGKSNILECIINIFAGLYASKISYQPQFQYRIEYTIARHTIIIDNRDGSISIDDQPITKKDLKEYLPKNVIACYSGETSRLQEIYFTPFRKRFVRNRLKNRPAELRLIYVNKDLWNISLLTLFLHNFDIYRDIDMFIHKILDISHIEKIRFRLSTNQNYKENEVKQLLDLISNGKAEEIEMSISEFRELIDRVGFTPKEVFMALYVGLYSHIFREIQIDIKSVRGEIFNANMLSEGEKKLLSIVLMLEVLGDENSLMLYDEPDSQIHVSRKQTIKELIEKYTNRQHLLTTHSPSLAKSFYEPSLHVYSLKKNEQGFIEKIEQKKSELIAELTNGQWNITEQNVFLASIKPITLLVEGKTDKTHIEEAYKRLKPRFPDLDFDVFAMNSSEHIREVLIGLSCSEVHWEKKFIGLFDNDPAGNKDISNGFEKDSKNERIKHVKHKDGYSPNNFYAFLLPKKNEFNNKESYTIENCYPAERYQEAFEHAVNDKRGYYSGLSIDKVANDIKEKSKIILADNCKSFSNDDFKEFIPIFEIIEEIRLK